MKKLIPPIVLLIALFLMAGDVLNPTGVCSPETSKGCTPGPFSETVTVPDGVDIVKIDVYWIWTGKPGSIQGNEHSIFKLAVNGQGAGSVYCQDFGDAISEPQFCGSKKASVKPGDKLTLSIRHADEAPGLTPGSNKQQWVLTWGTTALPTSTPTPVQPTAAPTATPEPSATPTSGPTATAEPTATATPLPTVLPADTPENETVKPTRTPPPTLPPPPLRTGQPLALIPVTGAGNQDLHLLELFLGGLGLTMIIGGLIRKR